jgi:hypothetical protein
LPRISGRPVLAVQEHLAGLGPHAAGDAERLGDHDAGDGEHGPARVDNLRHAVLLDLAVGAELQGVEAVVTGEGAVHVRGHVGVDVEEAGGEVQAAVGACEKETRKTENVSQRCRKPRRKTRVRSSPRLAAARSARRSSGWDAVESEA